MKKRLTGLLALVMLLSMIAGCGAGQTPQTEGVKLWYGYNTDRLLQDVTYTDYMEQRSSTLRMYGIRGDVESAQLIITPEEAVTAFDFELEVLESADGEKLRDIEVFSQWYVTVDASYNSASYGVYPDALVPMAALKREGYNRIAAGNNQGIWINVSVDADAKPGKYTGTGILELDGVSHEIPVELTVYDALMPEQVHLRSCFLIWYDYMLKGEGVNTGAVAQAYFDLLVEKRCMPMYPEPAIYNDYDGFVDWVVANVADNPKISTYALPYSAVETEVGRAVDGDKVMSILTKLAQKNVELRKAGNETTNLFEKAYFYLGAIIDEPTGNMLNMVKVCDLTISESKFAVADAYLTDYPDLYHSLIGLPHVVTTAYNEELLGSDTEGGVQAWCPQFQYWHSQSQREQYYARQNTTDRLMGEEAWWYGCNNPKAPFPTYHLDDDLIAPRVLSWMQYDYGAEGNLYWCINRSLEDMWERADEIGGAVCEGNLTYPGAKFKLKEPMSTLRLESIREGAEDYEYFWMIEQAIIAYNEANGTNHDPKALMAPLYEGLYDGMIPVRENSELFLERRLQVLSVLEQFTGDPAAAIETLTNLQ